MCEEKINTPIKKQKRAMDRIDAVIVWLELNNDKLHEDTKTWFQEKATKILSLTKGNPSD